MTQQAELHTRRDRYKRAILLAAGLALLAAALLAFWLARPAGGPPIGGVVQVAQVDGLQVTLQIDQPELGARVADIVVEDAGSPASISAVRLRFLMPAMDMGTIEIDSQPVQAGHFRAQGQFFTMAGEWTIEALLQRDGQPPLRVPFALAIAAPGEASGPLNPLSNDEATINAGRLLYQANCAACHGATGKGDGPAALGLRPSPSDFSQHMAIGKHTDGQVYLWIRDGYPQSAMPAWKQRLNDQQIWQLVTYLRSFGAAIAPATPGAASPSTAAAQTTPAAAPAVLEPLPPLVFTRAGNVWRSDGSAATPRPLTHLETGRYAEYPTIAADGEHIAFVATTQGPLADDEWPLPNPETSLYVMRADGSDVQMLWKPTRGWLGLTAWSPGDAALYVGYYDVLSEPTAPVPDRLFQILRVDPQTGRRTVMMTDAYDLTFSRDTKLIAFQRWHADRAAFTLNIAAPNGSGEHEIIQSGVFSDFYAPRFSPDGRQIIFASTGGPPTNEQGYPITARDSSPLDRMLGLFAPAMAEAHGSRSDLWIVNTDGSGLRRLTRVGADTPMAVFSYDGTQIVIMDAGGIYLMNADGGNLRKIDAQGDHGGLDWAR